jgi:hypothetical protein
MHFYGYFVFPDLFISKYGVGVFAESAIWRLFCLGGLFVWKYGMLTVQIVFQDQKLVEFDFESGCMAIGWGFICVSFVLFVIVSKVHVFQFGRTFTW